MNTLELRPGHSARDAQNLPAGSAHSPASQDRRVAQLTSADGIKFAGTHLAFAAQSGSGASIKHLDRRGRRDTPSPSAVEAEAPSVATERTISYESSRLADPQLLDGHGRCVALTTTAVEAKPPVSLDTAGAHLRRAGGVQS